MFVIHFQMKVLNSIPLAALYIRLEGGPSGIGKGPPGFKKTINAENEAYLIYAIFHKKKCRHNFDKISKSKHLELKVIIFL